MKLLKVIIEVDAKNAEIVEEPVEGSRRSPAGGSRAGGRSGPRRTAPPPDLAPKAALLGDSFWRLLLPR